MMARNSTDVVVAPEIDYVAHNKQMFKWFIFGPAHWAIYDPPS
jgi:hypothetical protein